MFRGGDYFPPLILTCMGSIGDSGPPGILADDTYELYGAEYSGRYVADEGPTGPRRPFDLSALNKSPLLSSEKRPVRSRPDLITIFDNPPIGVGKLIRETNIRSQNRVADLKSITDSLEFAEMISRMVRSCRSGAITRRQVEQGVHPVRLRLFESQFGKPSIVGSGPAKLSMTRKLNQETVKGLTGVSLAQWDRLWPSVIKPAAISGIKPSTRRFADPWRYNKANCSSSKPEIVKKMSANMQIIITKPSVAEGCGMDGQIRHI
ncbi:hypothetical protein C8R43DRAFT_1198517 [Mycena crocata]|nr:hypothetical protein C8R43DRAFT_1198517 [Mycena crocata]